MKIINSALFGCLGKVFFCGLTSCENHRIVLSVANDIKNALTAA